MQINRTAVHQRYAEPWQATLVDNGEETMTSGRLKRDASHVSMEDFFCFTYGDGVSDVNIHEHLEYQKTHEKLATLKGKTAGAIWRTGHCRCKQRFLIQGKAQG